MAVRRPSDSEILDMARGLGFSMDAREAQHFGAMMEGTLQVYDTVDAMADDLPAVRYPRGPATKPLPAQNSCNAWATMVQVRGAESGRLRGKRIVLKDSICLAGVPMAVGTGFLEGFVPEADATAVTRILDAGGEIVGKAQCEYLCHSGGSHTSLPRPVLNPYDPLRSAGGSSSGSAVLIATGKADMSLGADQGGSIRIPSAWCGVVGMKPTYGLVPYTGVLSMEATIDHVGPMSATVADNALLLSVIAGPDGIDPRQGNAKANDYLEIMQAGIRGLRIGVVREGFGRPEGDAAVDASVREACRRLAGLGATVEDVSIPVHAIGRDIWTPTLVEGAMDLMMRGNGATTNQAGLHLPSVPAAMARWRSDADECSIALKVLMLSAEHISRSYGTRFYGKSQNLIRHMRGIYDAVLAVYDLLVMPTTPQLPTPLPPPDATVEDVFRVTHSMNGNTAPFCGTGHPALSLPCGMVDGLPVGIMFVASHGGEATIYRAAYAFERSIDWRFLRT